MEIFLQLIELDNAFSGSIEYSTDLFDKETFVRMTQHFATLLEGIAANPEAAVLDLPLMDAAESRKVLTEWNQTQMAYADDLQLHQLVENQAHKTPDAIAVVHRDETVSYAELNARANRLAQTSLPWQTCSRKHQGFRQVPPTE